MKIKGLQKLTLIDFPGRIACSLFLFGCNFKCGFCHNPELVLKEELQGYDKDKVLDFLEKRTNYLDGVCITGGEPLMTLDLDFIKKIKAFGYDIKIDTNGSFPDKLNEVISENLVDYVSMDIKTCKEKYKDVVCADVDLEMIEESIRLISQLKEYEFRTTIVRGLHSKEDIRKMFEWLSSLVSGKIKKFVFQGFKNQGKLIDERLKEEKNTSEEYLKELVEIAKDYCDFVEVRV